MDFNFARQKTKIAQVTVEIERNYVIRMRIF